MTTSTASFPIGNRTFVLTLTQSPTGTLNLNCEWQPYEPRAMTKDECDTFADGMAEAIESLFPGAYVDKAADSSGLASKTFDRTLRKRDDSIDDREGERATAELIKQQHKTGGTPLFKQQITVIKPSPHAVITPLVSPDARYVADDEVTVVESIRAVHAAARQSA